MISRERNYCFIDGQNMHKGTVRQGWRVDYGKLMIYLRNKYRVEKAYIFLGYLKDNEFFYRKIEESGFIIIFKEVSYFNKREATWPPIGGHGVRAMLKYRTRYGEYGAVKGNCDSDMVLRICLEFWNFDKAVIISGDGDFYSMCQVLSSLDKFRIMLASDKDSIATRYYRFGVDKVAFLLDIKSSIAIDRFRQI